jgi:hypothetical protein
VIDNNPLTVFNRQLEKDELDKPIGSTAITGVAKAIGAVSQIPTLRPLGLIAKGFDLAGKCLNLGVPTVEENLKLFGSLTEEAVLRVEERLAVLETSADVAEAFQRRIESEQFSKYLASGVLQTQRTTQESRLKRMAWIIANGLKENDLDLESGDDMMRAAVELKDADIILLGKLYESQNHLLIQVRRGESPEKWHGDIQTVQRDFANSGKLNPQEHLYYRSSYSRLESVGFIQRITSAGDYGVGHELYALLPEGKKFYERLQEIAM